ncbi:hypothetical protein [Maridesulfovibrio sp.]|uniref:hypothetical protein n=1 Tax=Maridesulfovibrio sp. TaxID=2795000 RepID=UPI002A1885B4|nr:hypothetical protein [Maridesulfovibrio sp.]
MNIIKIRYVEPIFFMDVGEIVAAYSMETGGTVGASRSIYDSSLASTSSVFELGGTAKYTDRPTITYRPLTGATFLRGVMSPMPLRNVLISIESGASAEFFFSLGVRSINGLMNETFSSNGYRAADERFIRAVKLIAELQANNTLHVVRDPRHKGDTPLLRLKIGEMKGDTKTAAQARELKTLLGLDSKSDSYAIGFGSSKVDDQSIILQTYSLAQVLASVSGRVDMPADDLASHRAAPGMPASGNGGLFKKAMVMSGKKEPEGAFVSVKFRDSWFWVDDHDLLTKKIFSFMMLAFTLMDKGQQETQLQLTLPTQ